MEVLSRSGSGRVRQARVRGPSGSLVLSGSELRKRLGLKSTLVNFEMVTGGQRPSVDLPVQGVTTAASGGSRIDRITASVARQRGGRPPLLVAQLPLLAEQPCLVGRALRVRSGALLRGAARLELGVT